MSLLLTLEPTGGAECAECSLDMAGLKRENDSAVFAKLKLLLQSCRYFRLRNMLTNVSLERSVWADVNKTLLAKAWSIAVFVHW